MHGLSRNILLSTAMHGLAAVTVVVVASAGKGAGVRAPSPAIPVMLISAAGPPAEVKTAAPAPVRPAAPKVVRKTMASPLITNTAPPAAVTETSRPVQNLKTGEKAAGPSADVKGISIISGAPAGSSSSRSAGDRDGISATARTSGDSSGGEDARHSDAVSLIRTSIERTKAYPAAARRRGIEGTATAEFAISGNGRPVNIRIVRSSGSQILDAAALETITRAAPFPVISGVIEVPIVYRLEK